MALSLKSFLDMYNLLVICFMSNFAVVIKTRRNEKKSFIDYHCLDKQYGDDSKPCRIETKGVVSTWIDENAVNHSS